LKVKNVFDELNKVDESTFLELLPFNNTHLGAVSIAGESPIWEMHPDTDELFYILNGTLQINLLTETGVEMVQASASDSLVVPQGYWHKLNALDGAKFIYLTPGESIHSDKADPRV